VRCALVRLQYVHSVPFSAWRHHLCIASPFVHVRKGGGGGGGSFCACIAVWEGLSAAVSEDLICILQCYVSTI
jgi:hypothetical protein